MKKDDLSHRSSALLGAVTLAMTLVGTTPAPSRELAQDNTPSAPAPAVAAASASALGLTEARAAARDPAGGALPDSAKRAARARQSYARLPLSFEANQGQAHAHVDFLARGSGYAVFLTPTEAVLALRSGRESAELLRLGLVGSNPSARAHELGELPGKVNYFIGSDAAGWRTAVPIYDGIRYEDVYVGIDLVYHGNQRQLEYDFVVAPGADPAAIRLRFGGVDRIRVEGGELRLHTAGGEVRQPAPLVYQEVDGTRHEISGGYVLRGTNQVGFELGAYDASLPLVIDPVLLYSTFLGGSGDDVVEDIALDAAGNVYATGETFSTNFPTTPAAHDTLCGMDGLCGPSSDPSNKRDAFVTKFNPSVSGAGSLVYSTYLGGTAGQSSEHGRSIAVDAAGGAYVVGSTRSTDFPMMNPYQATIGSGTGGFTDAYLTKLNPAGSALVYSTYLGGGGDDVPTGVAVDGNGMAYVVGSAKSANFPVQGALQGTLAGGTDAFVSKLDPSASGAASLVYSTYLGGSALDEAMDVAVDASGRAYAVGMTSSTNFPVASALYPTFSGVADGFVSKLNSAGSALIFSTYLGGSGDDGAGSVAVDGLNNVYVTGFTASSNFKTASPLQPSRAGGYDGFVTKLNASGNALLYSTYLGGTADDFGEGIAVDPCERPYVTGVTNSLNFPGAIALQLYGGGDDAFVAGLNVPGSTLAFATYIGGAGNEDANGIAVLGCLSTGNPYSLFVGGKTSGSTFPILNAYQSTFGGGTTPTDGFVTGINIGTDADSDQLPDLVEIEEGRNSTVKDNDIFTSARLFAMQQYRDFLLREGDAGGVTYWTNAITPGSTSREQVIEFFFNSPEFQGTFAPIARLYFAYFLRIPDYAGLLYWSGRFRAGIPLLAISGYFAASPEFQSTYGSLTNDEFVDLVYQNVLGRAPDPAGKAYWLGQLNAGLPRGDMMFYFSESPEYLDRSHNWVYVNSMYVGMLRRAPDQSGFDFWVAHLDAGNSGLSLINGFFTSPEYHNRFLP